MAEFFLGLSTALGWGIAGVYVALGLVGFLAIAGVCAGVYAYHRRKNLKQNVLTQKLTKGHFVRAKVKNTNRFYNFLKRQIDAIKGKAKNSTVYKTKPSKVSSISKVKQTKTTQAKTSSKPASKATFSVNYEGKGGAQSGDVEEVEEIEIIEPPIQEKGMER